MSNIKIDYVAMSELQRWPGNPKRHDLDAIQKSVERFGFVQPLVVDEKRGKLVAGHGRLEALAGLKTAGKSPPDRVTVRKDGEWMVPVIRGVSFASEADAEAFIVADNKLTENGGWDQELLQAMLQRVQESVGDAALGVTGFSAEELETLMGNQAADDIGLIPEEKLAVFEAGVIKQVVLYIDGAEFPLFMQRLMKITEGLGAANNTDTFMKLMDFYEKNTSSKS